MENDYSGLLELAGEKYKISAYLGGASAFSQMMGSYMDYKTSKLDVASLNIQASNIELQAQQRANMLREQFVQALGTYQYGAAQRGVALSSGSVRDNMESSAMSLGNDISIAKKNAQIQARTLRGQASLLKMQAKHALGQSIVGGISSLAGAYANYQIGSQLTKMANPTLANGGKVEPVLSVNPFGG